MAEPGEPGSRRLSLKDRLYRRERTEREVGRHEEKGRGTVNGDGVWISHVRNRYMDGQNKMKRHKDGKREVRKQQCGI